MGTYNVSKIEGWLKDFTSAKDKFTNTYYSDYKNSYIRSCNDSAVIKMRNKLNQHYDRINRINKRIKDVWDDFLYDLKAIDNRLAGGKGSTNDSAVASKLSKLPTLKEYKADLRVRINSASAVVGTVDKIGWSEDRNLDENLAYFGERVGATISTFGVSLFEGVVKLGEDAVDLLALGRAVMASEYTGMIDLGSLIAAEITGDDSLKTNYTKQMWEETRAFVSKDYTGQAFDWLYDNTTGGQWMKENAYGFDTTRAIGSEVGEVVGVVALSIVTGGGAAYMYGAAKVAEHTEENWQDENTSTAGGFFKGTLQGVGDGIFFGIGMKGDAVMKSAATAAVKESGKQTVKKTAILAGKTLFECGCSVAQDGTNIMINAFFADDTITTPDGKTIRFNNFNDKLSYYYEQAGGMKGMMTSMATASLLSFASDTVDISKIGKNVNTNTALKNADINTSNTKKSISNVNTKNIDINIKSKTKGNTFVGDKIGGSASDPDVLKKIDELRNSKAVNTSNSKNINVKPNNDVKVNPLSKEYDDLLKKTKEPWFIQAKEARDNGWAWNLNEVNEVDNIVKRMGELEGNLGIKNTGIPESKIYDYSGAKKEADELARKISKEPIPGYENIDTNSQEYKKAMQEIYSKPSPSGKQILSNSEDIVKQVNDVKVAYSAEYLGDQSFDFNRYGSGNNVVKTIKDGNDFYINSKTFTVDDMKSINKNSRFKKTIVYITDDTNPGIIFQQAKKPKNVVVRVGDFEYLSDGNGIRINQWRNTASVEPTKPSFTKREKNNLDEVSKILNDWGKKQGLNNYADDALRNYAKTGSVYDNISGKPYITNTNNVRDYVQSLDPEVVTLYLHNKTLSRGNFKSLNNFFKNSGSPSNSTYGVNQGSITDLCVYTLDGKKYSYRQARDMINKAKDNGRVLPRFNKEGTLEYFALKDKLVSKGLTNGQASVILSSLDDVGACSYAAKANSIFYKFSDNPKLFEEKFGFPMYKVNANGEKVLNSNELLLDMYLFANDTANGGRLFSKNYDNSYTFFHDNRIDVFGRKMLNTENQAYISTSNGSNNAILGKYLNSKGLEWSSYNLITNPPNNILSANDFNSYINAINASINDGKSVQLNIFSNGGNIDMHSTNPHIYKSYSTDDWVRRETNSFGEVVEKNSGHAVFITGADNQGFTVSSWGQEYKILFRDLQNGGYFNIMIDDVDSIIY